jgi:hypothetical protein
MGGSVKVGGEERQGDASVFRIRKPRRDCKAIPTASRTTVADNWSCRFVWNTKTHRNIHQRCRLTSSRMSKISSFNFDPAIRRKMRGITALSVSQALSPNLLLTPEQHRRQLRGLVTHVHDRLRHHDICIPARWSSRQWEEPSKDRVCGSDPVKSEVRC